jgi:hypothetical protein
MTALRSCLCVLVLASVARAEPRLSAVPAAESPRLDGKLDDPAWQSAPATEAFVQKFPDENAAPSERTRVRVVYDAEAIWVAFDCEQIHSPIVARMTRRDRQIEADWVSVAFDTKGEGTHAFEFQVNAAGVLVDTLRFNDTDASTDWDENWDARVRKTAHGWTAELRIPLRVLRFDPRTQRWGLELRRYVSARNETDEWAFIPRAAAGEVSHYGSLTGLRGLRKQSPIELRPYALFRVRRRDAASGTLASGWDVGGSAGLDLKWHVTPNLTLDGTFYPDFAQVEADQVILNLTNYEIQYPEKRPFFLEGLDLFTTPAPLIYTRRIGHAPPAPALRTGGPFGEQLYDVPEPSTIYGAAKLTGTVGKRLSVGVLAALTGRNEVGIQYASGLRGRHLADPMTFYGAARLKIAAARNFDVGLMATTVDRFEPGGLYPLVPASGAGPTYALCPDGSHVATGARCFHDAHVGAVDFRWRSPGGDYSLVGQTSVTAITGGPPRTFPDGTVVRDGDVGGTGGFALAKEGGGHWLWTLDYDAASAKTDFNDFGYMSRQAYHHIYADVEHRNLEPWKGTLERHWQFEFFDRVNLSGVDLGRGYQLNSFGKTRSLWSWFVEFHYREPKFDDREVGDGTALERAGLFGLEVGFNSDPRRRVYAELWTQSQAMFHHGGGYYFYGEGKIAFRIVPQLDLDLLPTGTFSTGEPRYAGLSPAGEQLFGRMTASSFGATLRATWTFTPRITLQVYAQLFLAQKHYGQMLQSFATRPLVHLADLTPTSYQPATNPDVQEGVVNVNVVFRWEYRLGSTLFLVYTRSQVPNVMLGPGEAATLDLGAIRKGPAADVFLIKANYWWG